MSVRFKVFRSSVKSWDDLFQEAAEYATLIGEQRVINISQSCDNNSAVIAVWYWDK